MTIDMKRFAIQKPILPCRCCKTSLIEYYLREAQLVSSKQTRASIELQNTHFVLFKYFCDMMQVSTLSAQLGLRSELLDWYRDAKSVRYGPFID